MSSPHFSLLSRYSWSSLVSPLLEPKARGQGRDLRAPKMDATYAVVALQGTGVSLWKSVPFDCFGMPARAVVGRATREPDSGVK